MLCRPLYAALTSTACLRVARSISSEDMTTTLLYGHGLPVTDRVHPGPALAYWAPHALLLNANGKAYTLDKVYRLIP